MQRGAPPRSKLTTFSCLRRGRGGDFEASVRKVLPKNEHVRRRPFSRRLPAPGSHANLGPRRLPPAPAPSPPLLLTAALRPLPQIVTALVGCYVGIYGLVRIKSMMSGPSKVPAPAAAAAAPAAAGSGKYGWAPLNSVDELDAWTANATNMKTFEAFVSDPKNDKEISSWFDKM